MAMLVVAATEPVLIGLSVSFCIRDIAWGKVELGDVRCIMAGTCARSMQDWQFVADEYCRVYWKDCAEDACMILNHLLHENLIVQPRLEDKRPITYHGAVLYQGDMLPNYWSNTDQLREHIRSITATA